MTVTDRTSYTAGLRDLADLLDNNPGVPLPYEKAMTFFIHGDLDEALAIRYLMVDPVTSRDATSAAFPVNIDGRLAGLRAHVYVSAATAGVSPDAPRPPCDPRLGLDKPAETVRGAIHGKTYTAVRSS